MRQLETNNNLQGKATSYYSDYVHVKPIYPDRALGPARQTNIRVCYTINLQRAAEKSWHTLRESSRKEHFFNLHKLRQHI